MGPIQTFPTVAGHELINPRPACKTRVAGTDTGEMGATWCGDGWWSCWEVRCDVGDGGGESGRKLARREKGDDWFF